MSDSSSPGVMPGFDAAAHLAAIVDSADDAIIGKLLDGTIVSWNAGATRLFGFDAQAMIGQPVTRLIPDERLAEEGMILERIRRGERVADFETVRLCRDGSRIDVSVCVSPIRDAGGQVVGASKIARDIRRHAQMRDQAQQYRDLVETALDAVVAIDGAQRICLFNPAAEAMFGWSASQVLGQPLDRLLPEAMRAAHRQHTADFAAGDGSSRRMGAARGGGNARRVNGLRADGSVFPVEAVISRFGQGESLRMTVVLRDITDAQRAAALRNAAAMAQAANEAKSAFIARMTHELRTPMNAVLGFAHLLLADGHGVREATHRRHAQHIYSAGRHLLSLIDDLLDLARIEAGQMRVSAQAVALDALVLDVQSVLEPIARTSGITLAAAPPLAPALACRADPLRLRQVLYNLVANAIKYNRPQGQVHIEVKPHGAQQVEICISDTGEGLTEEQLQHLFEPFNRLGHERSGTPGTGLGLVVVRQLVALMQGDLSISSRPGQGTRACLTLPLAGLDDVQASAPGPAGALADEAPLSGRVLCIEDHPVNRLLVESILGGLPGVELMLAPDGQSGLAMLPSFRPDLVLLDMNLPDMNGLDWLAAVRADPLLAHTRVAIASASMRASDAADARALGIEGLLAKPLEVAPFLRQVRHWLSQARAGRPVVPAAPPSR